MDTNIPAHIKAEAEKEYPDNSKDLRDFEIILKLRDAYIAGRLSSPVHPYEYWKELAEVLKEMYDKLNAGEEHSELYKKYQALKQKQP